MNKIREFMAGRNGNDELGLAMLVAALVLNIVFRSSGFRLLGLAAAVLVVLVLYRMFSRDLAKRQAENRRFLGLWTGWKTRRAQSKTYKFFTCPGCRNTLRVPRGKGKIQITCPKCGQRFDGKS